MGLMWAKRAMTEFTVFVTMVYKQMVMEKGELVRAEWPEESNVFIQCAELLKQIVFG